MITPKLKKKYEKLILELRFLTADYDYHRMVYQSAEKKFSSEFEEYVNEHNLKISDPGVNGSQADSADQFKEIEAVDGEENRKRISAVANTLFKKIAKATHPDKLMHMTKEEQERRKNMFGDAQEASIKKEWYRLLVIATDLGIDMPAPTKEHILLLESKTRELRLSIQSMNQTYPMVFEKMPNQASKNKLFSEFAKATGYVNKD